MKLYVACNWIKLSYLAPWLQRGLEVYAAKGEDLGRGKEKDVKREDKQKVLGRTSRLLFFDKTRTA
jgi:hypothetical protein